MFRFHRFSLKYTYNLGQLNISTQPPQDRVTSAMFYIVTNDYRRVMQIPLLKGRFFSQRDTTASTPVVLIDEVMASHVFPGQDPIGKQISMIVIGTVEIVGVVGHVKHWGLDSDDTSKIRDQIYFPFEQVPDRFMTDGVAGLTLMVRSKPEPLSLVAAVRSRVAGPGRDQPIYGMQDDGADYFQLAGRAAIHDAGVGDLRGERAAAGGGRNLRRVVRGHAADARAWDPGDPGRVAGRDC